MDEMVSDAKVQVWFPGESLEVLAEIRGAAEAYVRARCLVAAPVPKDLMQAVRLLIARHLARRNSPDGTLGMSEFGVGRIVTVDRDIEAMIAPHRRVVV